MDLAIAMATEVDADLILANDPDGDRIAVGIRRDGEWELLNGDEIGTLLAEDLLSNGRMTGGLRPAVGTTVVSSSLLARIAAAHDAIYRETLTGFKWLSLAAEELEDARMVLAYEQALGVTVGDQVTFLSSRAAPTVFGARPQQKAYRVGAVLAAGVSTIDDSVAFMPLQQGQLFFVREGAYDVIHVRLHDADTAPDYVGPISAMAGPNTAVYDYTRLDPAFFNALQFERTAMRLILAIVVAIAAMNIISGLVMLVKNKGRDIAILRTMGATRGAVLRIFRIVGASIGVLGTLAGILLGVLFVVNIGPIQDFITFLNGGAVWDPSVYYLYRVPAELDLRHNRAVRRRNGSFGRFSARAKWGQPSCDHGGVRLRWTSA